MVAIRSLPFLALAAYVSAQSIDTLDPCGVSFPGMVIHKHY